MPSVLEQAASAGNSTALQLVLVQLPEYYRRLGPVSTGGSPGGRPLMSWRPPLRCCWSCEALWKALSLQRSDPAATPPSPGRHGWGAYKTASSRGDVEVLQDLLLMGGPPAAGAAAAAGDGGGGVAGAAVPAATGVGPDDNEQLVMLRLAAAGGHLAAVRLLLAEFGDGNSRLELCLATVCRAAARRAAAAPAGELVLQGLHCTTRGAGQPLQPQTTT